MAAIPPPDRPLDSAMRDANWRFASYLRLLSGRHPARIDALAERLARAAEAEIDCRTCGACCRDNCAPVSDDEIDRLAARLHVPTAELRATLTTDDDGQPAIDARPCPFLVTDGPRSPRAEDASGAAAGSLSVCSVYEDRPEACRGYPYIGGHIPDMIVGIIERAEVCPIIAKMLAGLKQALRYPL